jgi:hypothetical protein
MWHRIDNATNNYHPEGGVVVFANTEERARDIARLQGADIAPDEAPDEVRKTQGKEAVYIMPDAGCC